MKSTPFKESAVDELRRILHQEDECHPGLSCVDEMMEERQMLLDALIIASMSCGFNKLNTAAQKRIRNAIAKADQ